jgi:hypothetical protein
MPSRSHVWLAAASLALAAAVWYVAGGALPGRVAQSPAASAAPERHSSLLGGPLPGFEGAAGWTAEPVTPDSLAGHVTVVGVLSLDLPPSLGAARALQSWHEAYARYGLRVVGVQVPEFAFAAEGAAFQAMVRRAGLSFPLALDASLAVARAFGSSSRRPRFVLAGPDGRVVADREGMAALAEVEEEIRAQLQRARPELRFPAASAVRLRQGSLHAPVHLGQARVASGPLAKSVPGRALSFTAQLRYQVEGDAYTPYPVGRWVPEADGLTAARGGAENFVALRYDAGALGAVLGAPEGGTARFWILHDERWLAPDEAGADVRFDGRGASFVEVKEPGLYLLTRRTSGTHVVKLSPDSPGATIYAFTFDPFEPAPAAGR